MRRPYLAAAIALAAVPLWAALPVAGADTPKPTESMFPSEGTCEQGGKVLRLSGSYTDPASGARKTLRSVTKVIDKDHYTTEMYDTTPDGKEFKNMEIHYTRKSGA